MFIYERDISDESAARIAALKDKKHARALTLAESRELKALLRDSAPGICTCKVRHDCDWAKRVVQLLGKIHGKLITGAVIPCDVVEEIVDEIYAIQSGS